MCVCGPKKGRCYQICTAYGFVINIAIKFTSNPRQILFNPTKTFWLYVRRIMDLTTPYTRSSRVDPIHCNTYLLHVLGSVSTAESHDTGYTERFGTVRASI